MFDSRHNLCFHSVPPPPRAPRLFEPLEIYHGSTAECKICGGTWGCDLNPEAFAANGHMCGDCFLKIEKPSPAQLLTPAPAVVETGKFKKGDRVKCIDSGDLACLTQGAEYTIEEHWPLGGSVQITGGFRVFASHFALLPPAAAKPEEIDASKIEVGDWIKYRKWESAERGTNSSCAFGKEDCVGCWVLIEASEVSPSHIYDDGIKTSVGWIPLCAITHHSKTKPSEEAVHD